MKTNSRILTLIAALPFGHVMAGEQVLDLSAQSAVCTGQFVNSAAWQEVRFAVSTGRYVCVESLSSQKNDSLTSAAEIEALQPDGASMERKGWSIAYVSSEEVLGENGAARNVLDERPKTIWHTEWKYAVPPHPHYLVIDLKSNKEIAGLRILPRGDSVNGRIKDLRIYISREPFPLKEKPKSVMSAKECTEASRLATQMLLDMNYWKKATVEDVEKAVATGANVNAYGKNGIQTVLLTAIIANARPEAIATLVKAGADPNACDVKGCPILIGIASCRDVPPRFLKALINAGANLNLRGPYGRNALCTAILEGSPQSVAALVEAGTDLDMRFEGSSTALMFAVDKSAQNSPDQILPVLLKGGAKVNSRDIKGRTALIYAASESTPSAVRLLLDAGADTTAKCGENGKTALDYARENPKLFGTDALRLLEEATKKQLAQPKPSPVPAAQTNSGSVIGTWRQEDLPYIPDPNFSGCCWSREEITFSPDGGFRLDEIDPPYSESKGTYSVADGTVDLTFTITSALSGEADERRSDRAFGVTNNPPRRGNFTASELNLRPAMASFTCQYVRVKSPTLIDMRTKTQMQHAYGMDPSNRFSWNSGIVIRNWRDTKGKSAPSKPSVSPVPTTQNQSQPDSATNRLFSLPITPIVQANIAEQLHKPAASLTEHDLGLIKHLFLDHRTQDSDLLCLTNFPALDNIRLDESAVTDEGLALLPEMPALTGLSFYKVNISDTGMVHLVKFPALKSFGLSFSRVSGAGMKHLSNLPHLQHLDIGYLKLDSPGIYSVSLCTNLLSLYLNGTQVGSQSLGYLNKLTTLQSLDLQDCGITDDGLKHLSELSGLTRLDLSRNNITDAGLVHLGHLTALSELQLGSTEVTGVGLASLAGARHLQRLSIDHNPVSEAGIDEIMKFKELKSLDLTRYDDLNLGKIAELKRALPNCSVSLGKNYHW